MAQLRCEEAGMALAHLVAHASAFLGAPEPGGRTRAWPVVWDRALGALLQQLQLLQQGTGNGPAPPLAFPLALVSHCARLARASAAFGDWACPRDALADALERLGFGDLSASLYDPGRQEDRAKLFARVAALRSHAPPPLGPAAASVAQLDEWSLDALGRALSS